MNCHPLLRGGNKRSDKDNSFKHGFSSSQIQTLTAMCETIIPSLPHTSVTQQILSLHPQNSILSFFGNSASQPPIPDEVTFVTPPFSINVLIINSILFGKQIQRNSCYVIFLGFSDIWINVRYFVFVFFILSDLILSGAPI